MIAFSSLLAGILWLGSGLFCFPSATAFVVAPVNTVAFNSVRQREHDFNGNTELLGLQNGKESDTEDTGPSETRASDEKGQPAVVDFGKFNPFQQSSYTSQSTSSLQSGSAAATVPEGVSLRQFQMKEITGQLLDAVGNPSRTIEILEFYRDFLLEPLESSSATPLEAGSIFSPDMTRSQRFQLYGENMTQRISKAKDVSVRTVLTAMKEFVLSCE